MPAAGDMTSARLAAARVLLALEGGRVTLASALDRERPGIGDARDRALFMEVAAGTVRWRAQLDACLALAARRPIDRMEPAALAILRTSAYQLLHLERVPAHAVVHAAVDLTRQMDAPRARGFVNAVLRQLLRLRSADRLALPSRPEAGNRKGALKYLSVTLSHPEWLAARWLERHGFEATEAWCLFNNASPDVTVRVPAGAADVEAALTTACPEARPALFVPDAWRLPPGALGRLPADLRERLIVQDEGAQLVAHAAGVTKGDRVLDVCAAPGGKSLVFHEAAGPSGFIVAADFRPSRVALLRQTLAGAGAAASVLALDATQALPFGATFDRVILDAPCSGLGTLRRDPDLKWSRRESDLPRLADAAARMLEHAAETVRPGGRLLYATCSSEPDENDAVVDGFLSRHPEFHLQPLTHQGDAGTPVPTDERGLLRTLPFRHGLDAFFAALLVRTEPA